MDQDMQTITVDMDALEKKLQELGYSPTEISTAMQVFKEADISSARSSSSHSSSAVSE
jgi:uncharacterized protein Smg (DUF494 family)